MDRPLPVTATVEIDASPGEVWSLVSDVVRMGEWSPECRKVVVYGGPRPVGEGTRFVGLNRRGLAAWPTRSRVVRFESERAITWRVLESGASWTYELEPRAGGTRLSARRDLQRYGRATRLTAPLIGGAANHDRELSAGLETTLRRIKAEVERDAGPPAS